jgi:hydrogenase/urease accessory protein HupE
MSVIRLGLVWLLALVVPETSLAHSPIQGIGNFYNGLLHPVLLPAHLLLLIAVGLFLGQQGLKRVEPALGVFAAATILGLIVAWFDIGTEIEILVLTLSAAVSLLVAISPQVPLHWCVVIALLAGFSLGIDSAQEKLSGNDKLVSLFGSGVAIYFLALYPLALADHFNKKTWQKIGIRIVGSWIAASSLLVLAFLLSARP